MQKWHVSKLSKYESYLVTSFTAAPFILHPFPIAMEKYSPGEADQADRSNKADDNEGPQEARQTQASNISEMKPLTREAYGGGMYAAEDKVEMTRERPQPRASAMQSADGPEQRAPELKQKPPPSTGDRDLDITGLSYIQ